MAEILQEEQDTDLQQTHIELQSSSNKRIAKNTIALYVRMIFVMLVGLYTSRLVLNALGEVDFGLYTVVGGVIGIFSFIQGSMTASTQRYLSFEIGRNNKERLKLSFMTSTYIHSIIAFLILILSESIGLWLFYHKLVIPPDRVTVAFWVFQISIISVMIRIMYYPFEAVIIAHEKMTVFAYLSILDVVFKLFVALLLVNATIDKLWLYAVLNFVVVIIMCLVTAIYCRKHFEESIYSRRWDKGLFKEMSSFAGWNMWGNIAYVLNNYGFQVLLNTFFGPAINAASSIGSAVSGHITKFADGFQTAINPQITKTYATSQLQEMQNLVLRSMKFSTLLLLLIALPIVVELPLILDLWLKIPPKHTIEFACISLVLGLLNAIKNPINQAVSATGQVKYYQIITGLILISVVPFSYVVLKCGGSPESAMITYTILFFVMDLTGLLFIRRLINISVRSCIRSVFIPVMFALIVGSILPVVLKCMLPHSLFIALLISFSAFFSMLFSILYIGLTKDERNYALQLIKSRLKITT